jgi:uncharacterized membrane protein HdeD (DUF308 family)
LRATSPRLLALYGLGFILMGVTAAVASSSLVGIGAVIAGVFVLVFAFINWRYGTKETGRSL